MACVGLVSLLVLPAVFGLLVGGLLLLSWLSSMLLLLSWLSSMLLLPVCFFDLGVLLPDVFRQSAPLNHSQYSAAVPLRTKLRCFVLFGDTVRLRL